ncbi:Xaa-Pro aminopeptidase protein (plasmid) [Rhizobium gallicum]|uniref:Xaa-Pro aminopeptidase protein n=1 Tax=Rhizobium gallicum TaxID=56730 RepID=A0A1L5NPK4_9HYPH|nr:Xaa-Pro aminopeptidase protein [Rhizobium gallicum]
MFAAIEQAKLDALLVTSHVHLEYLTGYSGMGGYFAPFPLIMVPGRAPIFVARLYEIASVRAESCIDEIIPYTHEKDFAKVCADVLRGFGLQAGSVGFELGCWNLAPADVSALEAQLPDMKVADATRLVARVAAVLSDLELQAMRDAMAMTDVAVRTFQQSLREGITEAEVEALVREKVKLAGGAMSQYVFMVFGERLKLPHGTPTDYPLAINQPAVFESGGSKRGYDCGVLRGAVLGRHAEAEFLHNLSAEAIDAAIAVIKPGTIASEVDAAARKVIERSGNSQAFRHRTGYQTGIRWNDRGDISLDPTSTDILQVGMTFHMPVFLFGKSGYIFGTGEHVLVTERGAEILSGTPRTLFFA